MEEVYYHGSSKLFDRFDLSHALEGDGKIKFGYGVYVTSKYSSAAHYSASNKNAVTHYVYTVAIPEKTDDNWIAFKQPVHPAIVARTNARMAGMPDGKSVPEKVMSDGKDFRIWLGVTLKPAASVIDKKTADLTKEEKTLIKLTQEKAASDFLRSVGVDFIEWPYNWKRPEDGSNRAILDDGKVKILKIETVELDGNGKLVEGSQKPVK